MKLRYLAFLFLLCCVSANDPRVQLDLPKDFADSAQTFKFQRKAWVHTKAPLQFGDFRVVDYRRGWNQPREEVSGVLPPYLKDPIKVRVNASEMHDWYEFKLADAGTPRWWARCQQDEQSESGTVMGVPVTGSGYASIVCAIDDLASDEQWKFALDRKSSIRKLEEKATGELSDGDTSYDVVGLNRFATGATIPAPLGFRFAHGDETLGVLSLVGDQVKLPPNLEPKKKALIAAAMSAVILSKDVER